MLPWLLVGSLFGAWLTSVLGWLYPRGPGDWLVLAIALPGSVAVFFLPYLLSGPSEFLHGTAYRMAEEEEARWILRRELPDRWSYSVRRWYQRVFG